MKITENKVCKLVSNIKCGLQGGGIGDPEPGKMCVQSAIAYSMGLPFNDEPECVEPGLGAIDIYINDLNWTSNKARAKGMIREAISKLGSNKLNVFKLHSQIFVEVLQVCLNNGMAGYWTKRNKDIDVWDENEDLYHNASGWKNFDSIPNNGLIAIFKHVIDWDSYLLSSGDITTNLLRKTINVGKIKGERLDRFLTEVCDAIEQVLVELKSPGTRYLYLVK